VRVQVHATRVPRGRALPRRWPRPAAADSAPARRRGRAARRVPHLPHRRDGAPADPLGDRVDAPRAGRAHLLASVAHLAHPRRRRGALPPLHGAAPARRRWRGCGVPPRARGDQRGLLRHAARAVGGARPARGPRVRGGARIALVGVPGARAALAARQGGGGVAAHSAAAGRAVRARAQARPAARPAGAAVAAPVVHGRRRPLVWPRLCPLRRRRPVPLQRRLARRPPRRPRVLRRRRRALFARPRHPRRRPHHRGAHRPAALAALRDRAGGPLSRPRRPVERRSLRVAAANARDPPRAGASRLAAAAAAVRGNRPALPPRRESAATLNPAHRRIQRPPAQARAGTLRLDLRGRRRVAPLAARPAARLARGLAARGRRLRRRLRASPDGQPAGRHLFRGPLLATCRAAGAPPSLDGRRAERGGAAGHRRRDV